MTDIADLELALLDDVWVARLGGEIDLSNADTIGAAIETAFAQEGIGLVLDLTDVEYLDSAGVRLLFRIARSSTSRGWAMRAVVPEQSSIRRVLDLADIENVIGLDETSGVAAGKIHAESEPLGRPSAGEGDGSAGSG